MKVNLRFQALLLPLLFLLSIPDIFGQNEREAYEEATAGAKNPDDEYLRITEFLKKYPGKSAYRDLANKRISELDYVAKYELKRAIQVSEKKGNCDQLVAFSKKYPFSKSLVQEAEVQKRRICPPGDPCLNIADFSTLKLDQCFDLLANPYAGEKCRNQVRDRLNEIENAFFGDISCVNVQSYLDKFPNGRFRNEADSILKDCADESIREWELLNRNSVVQIRSFIKKYPDSRRIQRARSTLDQLDDKTWETAQSTGSAADYQSYLDDFPEGKYAEEARTRKKNAQSRSTPQEEENAFKKAMNSGSIPELLLFNEQYPESKYKTVVNQEIKRLEGPKYYLSREGDRYIVILENMENPRVINAAALSDALTIKQIESDKIILTPLKDGNFTIQIQDDWNKALSIPLNTTKLPFSGQLTTREDTLIIRFLNETPPFRVLFFPLEGAVGQRLFDAVDTIFMITKSDLYGKYSMEGNYAIVIEKDNLRDLLEENVPIQVPLRYVLRFAGIMLGLIVLIASVYWFLKRRISKDETLLEGE